MPLAERFGKGGEPPDHPQGWPDIRKPGDLPAQWN